MIHESREQLLDEVKALMYIALKTKRSLIIPNILVGATSMMCFVTWMLALLSNMYHKVIFHMTYLWLLCVFFDLEGVGLDRPGGPKSGIKPYDYNLNAKDKKHFEHRPRKYDDITTQPMDIAPKLG
jgi:hypothetical protein